VDDTITFSTKSYVEVFSAIGEGHIVSNPPYGLRLEQDNIEDIHNGIAKVFSKEYVS
jgi:23S rRNA G2445 N2-methylase RlmL